jgi:hypothetical protein
LLVFHTTRGEPNKKLKYLFFPTKAIPTYLLKEPKLTKWGQQCGKKNNIKIIKKNKTLMAFQMAFFHWNMHGKKKLYLYYLKCYFINLSL